MHAVMVADNPLDLKSWQRHDVESVGEFLYEHFNHQWPETARIYVGEVSKDNDVTPGNPGTIEEEIALLDTFTEPLWVVVYPATGVEVAIIVGIVALVASVAAILLIPDVPTVKTPKDRAGLTGSPNNSLGSRENVARPEQRIPYMLGFGRSIPDMLMVPYIQYENHRQVEIGYYCIGEGAFDIDDARDGDMLISQIEKASCHVYGPGEAPTGPGPHTGTVFAVGDPIADAVQNTFEIKAINGQSVPAFDNKTMYGAAKKADADDKLKGYNTFTVYNFFNIMGFRYLDATHGEVRVPYLKDAAFVHDRVEVGDQLFIRWDTTFLPTTGSPKPDFQTVDSDPFANAMIVNSITDFTDYVVLGVDIPAALSTEWAKVPAYVTAAGGDTRFNTFGASSFDNPYAEVTTLHNLFLGPFFVDVVHPLGSANPAVMVNFVAPNGLFAEDGTTKQKLGFVMTLGVTPCDSVGVPSGAEVFYSASLDGTDVNASLRALSFYQILPFSGRFLLRVRRTTRSLRKAELPKFVEIAQYGGFKAYAGRVNDEIQMTQAYAFSEPPNISFGNVTTVHTRTVNTDSATRLKRRELSLLCHRLIDTWDGASFTGPLVRDSRAENVLFTIMKDSSIGNRTNAEIDFAGIVSAMDAVRQYFNDSNTGNLATQVSITIDDANLSFEEIATLIANLAFCTIYRQGNVIRCKPELATDLAVVALNHRNILPGSQRITHTWGPPTENDSVEVSYLDANDDSITHVRVPLTGSTFSPKDVRVLGLGTRKQALWHAYRAYQRMVFQRQSLEMRCTQEAGLTIIRDRILVADVTVADKLSGHVEVVSGLSLRSSQWPISLGSLVTHTIFLQHANGTVEGIPVTSVGLNYFDLLLGSAPSVAIVTDPSVGTPTIFTIVADNEVMPYAYMVSEVTAESNMLFNVNGINYSNMYYFGDALEMFVKGNTASLQDQSPSEHPLVVDHGFSIFAEPTRGNMLSCDGANSFNADFTKVTDALDVTHGYTIFAWVKHTHSTSGYTGIAQTTNDSTVLFGFFDDHLAAGHNGVLTLNVVGPGFGTLHSMGVTWDPGTGRLALFSNGKVIASAIVAAPSTPLSFVYVKQYNGLVGDLVRYKRCFTDHAMMEHHLKTIV
jgi:hypothetical protein